VVAKDPNIWVSPHFTWGEVINKSGYTRPLPAAIDLPNGSKPFNPRKNAKRHARALERLRARLNQARKRHGLEETGIRINSWARSWKHNAEVGGAINSQHLYFLATDITKEEVRRLTPWDNGASFDRIASEVFGDGGFGQYPAGARHVDSRGWKARWSSWVGWRR
jgi:uncharacterized protein YcbK (DUF882 family)